MTGTIERQRPRSKTRPRDQYFITLTQHGDFRHEPVPIDRKMSSKTAMKIMMANAESGMRIGAHNHHPPGRDGLFACTIHTVYLDPDIGLMSILTPAMLNTDQYMRRHSMPHDEVRELLKRNFP